MKAIGEILDYILDPGDTTAGGGSASALSGAMAAALLAMVCRLPGPSGPLGAEEPGGSAEEVESLAAAGKQAFGLGEQLQTGSMEDRQAFEGVRAAFRLPKGGELERAKRTHAVQAAWLRAAEVPLANADLCWQVLRLAIELEGRTNTNALSDYRCAVLLARAGVLGCLENVAINLPMIKDEQAAARLAAHADRLRALLADTGANTSQPTDKE